MLRLISLVLLIIGIYIGAQYKDIIVDWIGQDSLDHIEQTIHDSTDVVKEKLEELKE